MGSKGDTTNISAYTYVNAENVYTKGYNDGKGAAPSITYNDKHYTSNGVYTINAGVGQITIDVPTDSSPIIDEGVKPPLNTHFSTTLSTTIRYFCFTGGRKTLVVYNYDELNNSSCNDMYIYDTNKTLIAKIKNKETINLDVSSMSTIYAKCTSGATRPTFWYSD